MADRDALRRSAEARVGTVLKGKYKLESLLGLGGMAAVYKGAHRNGNRVAVKMLHEHVAGNADAERRFLLEGYAANNVDHPGVVRVLDDDVTQDGAAFVVMELLDGETLGQQAQRNGGVLPDKLVLTAAHQLLDVLAAAEAKGIVHRDIKPDNLFMTTGGTLKLLDFGVAKVLYGSVSVTTTMSNGVFGTLGFMPPEQALGNTDEMDARSDIWAVGATMFRLLSGKPVHEAVSPGQLLLFAVSRPARSLASVAPHVAPAVVAIVDKALRFSRDERWQDARAMQRAVADALADLHRTAPPETAAVVPAPALDATARRRRRAAFAAAIAVVALASAVGLALGRRGDEPSNTAADAPVATAAAGMTGAAVAPDDTGPAPPTPSAVAPATAAASAGPTSASSGVRPAASPGSKSRRKPGAKPPGSGAFDYQ